MSVETQGELVLVTGGAGFIGSHTVDALVEEGCRVVIVDDLSSGKRTNISHLQDNERVELVEANVADGIFAPLSSATRRLGPVDRIIHLAAQTSVVFSVRNPLDDVRVNCNGTVQVLEYARSTGVKKVAFASSAAVYSERVSFPIDETADVAPISPYGIDKYSSEMFLRYYSKVHAVPSTVLRFFNVYGPRQDPDSPYSGVISIFADRAIAGKILTIFGDGSQTRDFVFVGDVARALVRVSLSDDADGEIFNIGTGVESTVNELANLMVELCDSRSSIEHLSQRPGEIRRSVADVARARSLLGVESRVGLGEGLRQTLDWLRSG